MGGNCESVSPGHWRMRGGTLTPRQQANLTSILFKAALVPSSPMPDEEARLY